jgi:patatin-like phospholipase/acyl hydrolase
VARQVRVLAIDGGGIRGIIPATVLAALERQAGRPASELFDLIAGTSTGGIIALGVTAPRAGGGARWSAAELVEMYVEHGPKIFSRSLLRKIETLEGLREGKYSSDALDGVLAEKLGDARLSDALTDVLIPAYDIQTHDPFFFKSRVARADPSVDYLMRTAARATAAAPTYFSPAHAIPPRLRPGWPHDHALVDGGIYINNPAMSAYAEVLRDQPGADVLLVSLGTGRLTGSISYREAHDWGLVDWARPLISVIMDGTSAAIDYQLEQLLGADRRHFRFQTLLADVSDRLDDASPANIAGLVRLADQLAAGNEQRIAEVARLLTG